MARLPLPPAETMKLVHLADIAKGGMGSVHMARVDGGRLDGQVVAIKRLHPNVASDPQFVGMFLDEAWMTAALKSPNVISVAAWGNDAEGMFLAVELVRGVSLSRLVKEAQENKEPFAERTVAFLGSQICAGLAAAHGLRGPDGSLLGLVHRDLTPGNILVGFDGSVKIADFGIAKAEERITHTRTGMLKGKPAYMAPEQARGGKVDARSDLFSFGVMLFELLAGRKPWTSKSAFDVMMEAATAPTPDLAELRRGVNPLFVEIVNKCLAKKPEERFQSAQEIQAKLDAWRNAKGFVADDADSLGHFVRRNTATQMAWFDQAIRGDLARGGAPTFKDVEEKIDEAREAKERPRSRPRPAAGGAPQPPAARPAPAPVPAPAPAWQAPPQSERMALGGTQLMDSPLPASSRAAPPAPPAPPSWSAPSSQRGASPTSDRGGSDLPLPPPRAGAQTAGPRRSDSSSRVPIQATPAPPPATPAPAPYASPPHAPPNAFAAPPSHAYTPAPPHAAPSPYGAGFAAPAPIAAAPPAGSPPSPTLPDAPPPTTPMGSAAVAATKPSGGGGRIFAILALLVLLAGGGAAWLLRDRLFPPARSSAPAAKP